LLNSDDQFVEGTNSSIIINNDIKLDEITCEPEVCSIEKETECREALPAVVSDEYPFPSVDLTVNEPAPTRRTFVILTELDEPFFGPYPIEFTITI